MKYKIEIQQNVDLTMYANDSKELANKLRKESIQPIRVFEEREGSLMEIKVDVFTGKKSEYTKQIVRNGPFEKIHKLDRDNRATKARLNVKGDDYRDNEEGR